MIHILDNNLINKIAAGEVVDRPASVVKELVENSIDAGADFIVVEIKNGGMDLIEVLDNGKGMDKKDAILSVKRHATSKIEKIEDLCNIMSFGFRGEALSAISSVSKFSLQTKEKGAVSGVVLNMGRWSQFSDSRVKGPDLLEWEIEDLGCSDGTKIRVENLFYNIPARRKFLKSAQTEFNHILNTLTDIALANFNVRFKFIHNGRVIFDYHAADFHAEQLRRSTRGSDNEEFLGNGWAERVKDVLGSDNFSKMISFCREAGEMTVCGFLCSPTVVRTTKGMQHLFVNNRPVYNNIVHKAIYNGYKNLIPSGMHPFFVVKIDLEPELVDVNVHPRKMEVKFLYQQDVFKTVEAVVREAVGRGRFVEYKEAAAVLNLPFDKLRAGSNSSNLPNSSNKILNFKSQISNKIQNLNTKFQNTYSSERRSFTERRSSYSSSLEGGKGGVKPAMNASQVQFFNDTMFSADGDNKKEEVNWNLIGQIKNLYLAVETYDGLVLIDQHATHERIIYDKIIENMEKENYKAQQILIPLKIELSLREMENIKQGFKLLKEIGFEIEEFSLNTIIVQTVPQDIAGKNVEKIIKGIISDLLSAFSEDLNFKEKTVEKMRNKIVCYIACRSAVKAGDELSQDEKIDLVKKVMEGEVKSTCPHGRPIMVKFGWRGLEKQFKRIS